MTLTNVQPISLWPNFIFGLGTVLTRHDFPETGRVIFRNVLTLPIIIIFWWTSLLLLWIGHAVQNLTDQVSNYQINLGQLRPNMTSSRLILRTRSPEPEFGVRRFWMNSRLTVLTIYTWYINVQYIMCGLSTFSGGTVFPPMLGGTVWARRVPPGVNKWSNRTEELSSLSPPRISATLVS